LDSIKPQVLLLSLAGLMLVGGAIIVVTLPQNVGF